MPVETEKKPEEETETPLTQSQLNAALASSKRQTEKLIADAVAKAIETFSKAQTAPKPDEEPAEKEKGKAGESKLQRELETIKNQLSEEKRARIAEVEARRRDAAQSQLRSHFEGANVRKEALDVLVAAATVNGMLRYDEDGKPLLAVKRSRSKGAAAEEQTFDDFKQGIEDWAKSPEAAAFIKAPTTSKPSAPRAENGALPKHEKEPANEDELVARAQDFLASRGG